MEQELLEAIKEFKSSVEKNIHEDMEEMIYFNRKLKNIIMDRLFEIFRSYNISITIQQVEELVDLDIFPMINNYMRNKVTNKSESHLRIIEDFTLELMPDGQLLPLDDSGKEIINKAMEKYMNLSEESRKTKIDFSELYEDIKRLLKKENLLNLDDFELRQEINSSFEKTQLQTEEYYDEKTANTTRKSETIADNIYQMYLQLIEQKTYENQNISNENQNLQNQSENSVGSPFL